MDIRSLTQRLALLAGLAFTHAACALQVEVHDPVMAKEGDHYYVFSTGPGITIYRSDDLEHWRWVGRAFEGEPDWARTVVPDFSGHLWAPDIFEHDGKWYLYYSVSAFGKNTSAMGVTVSETLDPDSPDYGWTDLGPVIQSVPHRDDWNAIDPAIVEDDEGQVWMSFGSFWSGLKLFRLDETLAAPAEPQEWASIARRPREAATPGEEAGIGAIEAPYIFRKGDWYYQFVSFDLCCRGMNSTYNVRVGRSKDVTGPYLDRDGVSLVEGGGTLVIGGNERWVAVGHNAAYTFDGKDWLVLHAYETADEAKQKLRILPISWDDGWPHVDPADLDRRTTELLGDGPPENNR